MRPSQSLAIGALIATALIVVGGCAQKGSAPRRLRLATTTSTRDSGLLDELLPEFMQQHNVQVDVIAVGSGKALKLGEAGDVDVVLVHAREAEDAFMVAGHGVRREDVMSNTFEIIGPAGDPAEIRELGPVEALQRIAKTLSPFVSRGDDSGTHKREVKLWDSGGGRSDWDEYFETGQGMGATLTVADEKRAYTLVDRGTFLRFRRQIDLVALVAGGQELENPYGIMVVNGEKHRSVQGDLANEFVDFLISPKTQRRIGEYNVEGEPLFDPHRARGAADR